MTLHPDIAAVLSGERRWCVVCGDCADALASIPDCSVDSVVCDPPAGISFMGKAWDSDKGGRDQWIAWLTGIMRECLRVLKPGGHAVVWALPRTSHWTATAIEDAGFQIREKLCHLFGSGFPKSLNVSKAIDAAAGAEREVVGTRTLAGQAALSCAEKGGTYASGGVSGAGRTIEVPITAPATPEAARWEGWGTALKPAVEDWILARKPLRGTVAANVLEWGTGAVNVGATRVGTTDDLNGGAYSDDNGRETIFGIGSTGREFAQPAGRFPANLLLTHAAGCRCVGTGTVATGTAFEPSDGMSCSIFTRPNLGRVTGYADENNRESVPVYACAPGCPVAILNAQSGDRPGMSGGGAHAADYGGGMFGAIDCTDTARCDSGGAARFFPTFEWSPELDAPFAYIPKPSREEREAGCESLPARTRGEVTGREDDAPGCDNPRSGNRRGGEIRNGHPTVKPIALMRWLCRLVTQPGGIVLDPFAGSGTTIAAARMEEFRAIGIEREPEYVAIARARVSHRVGGEVRRTQPEPEAQPARKQLDLFGTPHA